MSHTYGDRIPASTAAAYQAVGGNQALAEVLEFCQRIRSDDARALIETVFIPIRSGRAWRVPAGHTCRITAIDGPQVGDLNIWSADDPRERMWAARTRQLQAAHISIGDRIWSNLPFLRPLATVVDDTLAAHGTDAEGGRVHDLLGTRCDPYVNRMLTGVDFDYCCHSNLTRAVQSHGLTEFDVHDVLNVFQCTGLNSQDKYYMKTCPAKKGDFFEIFAEINLLCAISTCPGGDLSIPLWGPDARDPLETCRPLQVEVFKASEAALTGWRSPERAQYKGNHGLRSEPWPGTKP